MGSAVPREARIALEAEIKLWTGARLVFFNGSKHPYADVHFGGRHQRLTLSGSPRNMNDHITLSLQTMRRLLRAMGAKRTEGSSTAERAPRRITRPPASKPAPAERAASSPFAPLRKLQAGLTDEQLGDWKRFRVSPEKLDIGARLLIKLWHPQFILRAAEFITQAMRENSDGGSHEPAGAPENADAAAADRRTG